MSQTEFPESSPLQRLTDSILESAKYRRVSKDLILRLGERELQKRKSFKEAVKETKNTLHQIAGAYLDNLPPYARWIAELERLQGDAPRIQEALKRMMISHSSTRERLPHLQKFYSQTISEIGEIESIVDIACGLNPLALSLLPLAEGGYYFAYDLYGDMMSFLNSYFALCFPNGSAEVRDVVAHPPTQPVKLALILKFLPVLEQTEKEKTLKWLKSINANYFLISFPTKTLSGRSMRMAENYEKQFSEILQQPKWNYKRTLFDNELCYLIEV